MKKTTNVPEGYKVVVETYREKDFPFKKHSLRRIVKIKDLVNKETKSVNES